MICTDKTLIFMSVKKNITMDMNGGVNPVQSGVNSLGTHENEIVSPNRDAPPPYTVIDMPVTTQPVIHQTIIVQPALKGDPICLNCPRCEERILTKIKYVTTRRTHLLAGFICGFTFWCLICCLAAIPYLVPTFKRVDHYCPNCGTVLGHYSKL